MSARKRGLGRGLDALLEAAPAPSAPRTLAIDLLKPNRGQPRSHFDENGLEELADSIRVQGILQPLIVSDQGDGTYRIVAGERRWRASQRAGLAEVPVVVREAVGDRELLEIALVENLQRADLNPLEEADAYRSLATTHGLAHEEIARRVGKSRAAITNTLRLLNLPEAIQDLLRDGRLSAGQARPLLTLDEDRQLELARRAASEGLSARDLERRVQRLRQGDAGSRRKPPEADVHTQAAAERLTQELQTRVEIRRRGRGGEIRIRFHSEDELIRLYDHIAKR